MMPPGISPNPFHISLFISISISIIPLTAFSLLSPLHHQTLLITSLPEPPQFLSSPGHLHPMPAADESELFLQSLNTSFSLDLYHVDSLISPPTASAPTFNSTSWGESLFRLRLRRDALRFKALSKLAATARTNRTRDFSSSVISGLTQGSGEYFTRIGVGTPPKYLYMVLDTGSDVVWIQCAPCRSCYTQSDPVFFPRKSTTFRSVPCGSTLCSRLDTNGCSHQNKCLYQVSYGDGSFTIGEFSTETLTFRRRRAKNIALGCGHDNEGLFVGAGGLLGLGRGKLSFPTQAGRRFGRKFSYCLVDRSDSSKPSAIMFGEASVSKKASFTPLLNNPKLDTFYYVGLTGISVGGQPVPGIKASVFKLGGGVIVDSGTSVTRLSLPAYVALRNAFRAGARDLKRAPGFSLFDTCFDLSGKAEVKVPTVVLHFTGAAVSLPASNYLIPVDGEGKFCFAFAGTKSGLSIIGNIQQQGFRVVFDLARNRVGFAANAC